MLNKDHVLISETAYLAFNALHKLQLSPQILALLPQPNLSQILPTVCGIWLGSQLPDIDIKSSKIGRWTKPISSMIAHFGHRGFTHSLWFLVLIYLLCMYILPKFLGITSLTANYALEGITIGVALHILEDSFSKAGVIWLFPLGNYHQWHHIYVRNNINKTFRYKTGGKTEKLIRRITTIILCCTLFILISTSV